MQILPLLATFAALAQSHADPLPEHLHCQLIGEAGCGANGICTGGGRRDKNISMAIHPVGGTLVLNGIRGRLEGSERLDYGQTRSLYWSPRLIGLSEIHVRPERDYRFKNGESFVLVELTNGHDLIEFRCQGE